MLKCAVGPPSVPDFTEPVPEAMEPAPENSLLALAISIGTKFADALKNRFSDSGLFF